MEGDSYMLCLNSSFFREDENVLHLLEDRFEEMVDGVCILNMGKAEKSKRMKTNKAFFHFSDLSKRADSYIVTPVCGEGKVYGYGVLKRDFDICENNVLYIWTRHMGQFLQQVRFDVKMEQLNEKLERLSVTDALTGVYNRTGLERIVAPFMERISADGKQGMIFIADIDCMKNINDTRGHSAGDLAIRTVADTLRESVPDGFMVVRYGGDEFVVMGEAIGKLTMERIIDEISVGLESICKERKIDFGLTISVGGYLMEAGEKFDLVRSLQKADENMYAVKSMHHEVLKKQEKRIHITDTGCGELL